MTETEISYHPKARGKYRLLEEMHVERGESADWVKLCNLHYKMNSLPVGAKYWRVVFRGETIGVCVFGVSRPLLKERHALFPLLKPGQDTQISNIQRYAIINDDFRVVGRFVVDTMFRSAGVAYRFINLAARQYGYKIIEIQSSMSKYNSFAQRAGFQMVRPIRSPHYEKGVKAMRKYFAAHPADQEALMDEFNLMSPAMQRKVERELKTFYYDHSPLEKTGTRRHTSAHVVDNWDIRRTLGKIQGLCFASPLYGYYRNPELGRAMPEHLPLLAFDLQLPSEPLAVDRLHEVPGWLELRDRLGKHRADHDGGSVEQEEQHHQPEHQLDHDQASEHVDHATRSAS